MITIMLFQFISWKLPDTMIIPVTWGLSPTEVDYLVDLLETEAYKVCYGK